MKILILGNGYIGSRCREMWAESIVSDKRINSIDDIISLLNDVKPDAVLNAAGKVGKPNLDWCEDNKLETIKGNTELPIWLAHACADKNTYLLHIGSGCIFDGPSPDPKGWREDDFGNPTSTFARTKYAADLVLSTLDNVGIARIRLPMDYRPSSRNLIDKLASYSKVVDVENSLTVIEDMVGVFYQLIHKKAQGIFHVTNPGSMKNRDIIKYYQEYVDKTKTVEWITEESLVATGLGKNKRATNILQSGNLEKFGIHMRASDDALIDTMKRYAEIKRSY